MSESEALPRLTAGWMIFSFGRMNLIDQLGAAGLFKSFNQVIFILLFAGMPERFKVKLAADHSGQP